MFPADAIYVGKPRFAVTPVLGDDPGVAPVHMLALASAKANKRCPKLG